jgi:activator of 2-hydroxyglutaryl-CoA dehydratase
MKNHLYLSLIIIFFLFISCSQESKVKKEINEYVEKNFNDPDSYELIDLRLFDTINEQKVSKYLTNQRTDKLKRIKQYVKEKREEQSKIASNALFSANHYYLISAMNKLEKQTAILNRFEKDSVKIVQNEINKLKKYVRSKKMSHYRYVHEYRAKNDVGALVKCIDTLRINKDLTLIEDFQDFLIKKYGTGLLK